MFRSISPEPEPGRHLHRPWTSRAVVSAARRNAAAQREVSSTCAVAIDSPRLDGASLGLPSASWTSRGAELETCGAACGVGLAARRSSAATSASRPAPRRRPRVLGELGSSTSTRLDGSSRPPRPSGLGRCAAAASASAASIAASSSSGGSSPPSGTTSVFTSAVTSSKTSIGTA